MMRSHESEETHFDHEGYTTVSPANRMRRWERFNGDRRTEEEWRLMGDDLNTIGTDPA